MSLNKLQQQLNASRDKRHQLSDQWQRSRESLRTLAARKARLTRQGKQQTPAYAELSARERELAKIITQLEQQLHTEQGRFRGLYEQLNILPPQQTVTQLNDNIPILLFPVRLETRFKKMDGVQQLWLRIYPDDINIITHEEQLTEDEVRAAEAYWQQQWRAGTDKDRLLGAWRMLASKYGFQRAAWIVKTYQPNNPGDRPTEILEADVALAKPPEFDSYEAKLEAWSLPPRTMALPDRFVVQGYVGGKKVMEQIGNPVQEPLIAGPHPSHPHDDNEGFKEGEPLQVDKEMQWMVDFDTAINVGMGMRINLDGDSSNGFDRLVVLGMRLSEDEVQGQRTLEALFDTHHYEEDGVSLIPLGTATNNTGAKGAGYKSFDPADDESFNIELGESLFADHPDWKHKTDGQYLAEYLGISSSVIQHMQYSDGFDQRDARAVNIALWPATLGYFLEEMLDPLLASHDVRKVQQFFTHHVSGRGPLPSLRVGNQPYGILPTSAFSRWRYPTLPQRTTAALSTNKPFEQELYEFLMKLQPYWKQWSAQVSHVGKSGDSQQNLLNVLGLHASSAEFYQRFAISLEQLSNMLKLNQLNLSSVDLNQWLQAFWSGMPDEFGLNGATPDILKKVFYHHQTLLNGPLIDDVPLSETDTLKPVSQDDENYLDWLANSDIDTIRRHDFGRSEGRNIPSPRALLYLLTRHAVMNAYWDSAWNFYISAELAELAPRKEPVMMYVSQEASGQSKFAALYREAGELSARHPGVFPDRNKSVAEQISHPDIIEKRAETKSLREVRQALNCLKDRPTAKLANAFTEHLDLCGYRFDAWLLGLVNQRLQQLRSNDSGARQGIYLGAYGVLENVRPKTVLQDYAGTVPDEFKDPTAPPLQSADKNAGYIHAPSLNHAITAAVLRNAHITHTGDDNRDAAAVNISSERMRMAMSIIEGMQNGQLLGALLGYQLERGLHDRYNQAEVDQFIYPLRKKFPLVADQLNTSPADSPIEAVEARNVINGVSLLRHIDASGNGNYPFGLTGLPNADHSQAGAIDEEVVRLQDIMDAVSDLMTSESVYQVVRGNYERANAVLTSLSRAENLPSPEILDTPRSGFALTHRVGIQFETGIADFNPYPGSIPLTPRAKAEPGINKWLAALLDNDPTMLANVQVTEIRPGATPGAPTVEEAFTVNLQDLALQPIDLVYLAGNELTQQESGMDQRIVLTVRRKHDLDAENTLRIDYTASLSDKITLFEMMPLLKNLRSLIQGSRAINAEDLRLPSDDAEDLNDSAVDPNPQGFAVDKLKIRVESVKSMLADLITDLENDKATLTPGGSDSVFNRMRDHLLMAASLDLSNVLPEQGKEKNQSSVDTLLTLADHAISQLNERLANYNALTPADPSASAAEQVEAWIAAGQALLGNDFSWTAEFDLKLPDEMGAAFTDSDHLLRHVSANKPFPVDEWLYGIARVRDKLKAVEQSLLLVDNFKPDAAPQITPLQLPYKTNDFWLAMEYPEDYVFDGDRLLLDMIYAGSFDKNADQAGLLIDEWVEVVPTRSETSGIAFHFDAPNSEPPNTCLLAVSPELTGQWQWDDITATINETFDLAKQRAVEPTQIDESQFAQFLPGVMLPTTRYLLTVATNLLANVGKIDADINLPSGDVE